MDKMLHRKINLLIHMAHVDGKFSIPERDLIRLLLKENGLPEEYLEEHRTMAVNLGQLKDIPNKSELLYWILRLIHSDGILLSEELSYAKTIAQQLGFKDEVISHFNNSPTQSLTEFELMIADFQIT
jgi:hypothetical protein